MYVEKKKSQGTFHRRGLTQSCFNLQFYSSLFDVRLNRETQQTKHAFY